MRPGRSRAIGLWEVHPALLAGWTAACFLRGDSDRRRAAHTAAATHGLILAGYGLLPWATAQENAAWACESGDFTARTAFTPLMADACGAQRSTDWSTSWLGRLGIADLWDQYPSQISGGQRQRTAIARTLAMNPNLLLMDEPFSSLDALTREDLERLILELRSETEATTVLVTHNIEEAVYVGQRLLLLRRPPHREPIVIENPDAGQTDYREQSTFQSRCNQIRDLLGDTLYAQA